MPLLRMRSLDDKQLWHLESQVNVLQTQVDWDAEIQMV
jgi:hypothetical protein